MSRKQLVILSAAFGLSGFAALTYQITWIRELSTFFGIQVYATATVLTAFMAGLALGSWLFGRWADRVRNPLMLFVLMEAGLALFALLFPWIKSLIGAFYLLIYVPEAGPVQIQLLRFISVFPFLLVATSLMGGTLPVLTRGVTQQISRLGSTIGLLYGSNNLGAFLGGFITGYILLQTIGIQGALWLGALLNGVNALVVLLLYRTYRTVTAVPAGEATQESPVTRYKSSVVNPKLFRIVLWVFALEGFTTLAYEVLWTRILLEFSYDKTSFVYTTIIIAFVGGLGIGSYIIHRFIDRIREPVRWLARVEILIGLFYLLLLLLFLAIAPGFREFQERQEYWFAAVGCEHILFFLILVPPVILMGFTLPLVSVIYSDRLQQVGSKIGVIGMLDTIGSVAGSFVAGFIMLPLLGTVRSFVLIALINIALGIWIVVATTKKPLLRLLLPALVLVPALLIITPFSHNKLSSRWNSQLSDEVLYYEEGPAASVAVTKMENGYLALSINGAITAHTNINDIQVHTMLAALPWICCDHPDRALVVGLGMGVTARTLVEAGVTEVDIAEISPEVIRVSELVFGRLNDHVIRREQVTLYREDGRALLYQTKKKYDLITSNAVHPRLGNSIYTTDYYQLCLEKLSPGGVMCQWVPTNWMSEPEYKTLIHSFTSMFPYTSLWLINDAHTILVGSGKPLPLSYPEVEEKYRDNKLKEYLWKSEYLHLTHILKHYWMNDSTLRHYGTDARLNTDDRPIIEYSKTISRQPNTEVLQSLLNHRHDIAAELHLTPESYTEMQLESEYEELWKRLNQYLQPLKTMKQYKK